MTQSQVRTGEWLPIETFDQPDYKRVDLWVDVPSSAMPLTGMMADAWRMTDCWRKDGLWFDDGGRLEAAHITHWMPIPKVPTP